MPFGEHGLGQELRDNVCAIINTMPEITFDIIDINYSSLKDSNNDLQLQDYVIEPEAAKATINVICLNPVMYRLALRDHPDLFANRYNILMPFWEFDIMPNHFVQDMNKADEIWTKNNFLTKIFDLYTLRHVEQLPLFSSEVAIDHDFDFRKKFQIDQDAVVFLSMFDCNSLWPRKDPEASILAFLDAFKDRPDANVFLILKYKISQHGSITPGFEDVIELAQLDPRIVLVDEKLDRAKIGSLLNACDVFLSPHRCEGLGKGIVEAIHQSKAIIATGYSGIIEHLHKDFSIRIPYILQNLGKDYNADIQKNYSWAIPDIHAITQAMIKLYDHPKLLKSMKDSALSYAQNHLTEQNYTDALYKRLSEIINNDERKNFAYRFDSGERQIGATLSEIRQDHVDRYLWVLNHIKRLYPDNHQLAGADIFCGNGYGSSILSEIGEIWGIDGSEESIIFAQENFSNDKINFEYKLYPCAMPKNKFDFVVSMESIEHVDKYDQFLGNLVDMVKDYGYIFLSTPNQDVMPHELPYHKFHFKHFTLADMSSLAEKHQLQCIAREGQNVYNLNRRYAYKGFTSNQLSGQFNLYLFKKLR